MFDRDSLRPSEGRAVALVAGLVLFGANAAHAQAAAAPADGGAIQAMSPIFMALAFIAMGYFLIWRPQQKRAKTHQAMISAVKRGDTVVLSNGMVGKVTRVEEQEAMVEIATGVNTRVIKSMIAEVRTRGEPAPAEKS